MWSSLLAVLALSLPAIPGTPQAPTGGQTPPALTPLWPAPEGTWPCRDGSTARTRATATVLRQGPLHLAGSVELPAEILGEPYVSGGFAFVVCGPEGSQQGVLMDLETLRPLGTPVQGYAVSLAPCLSGDLVALRSAPDQLRVLRMTAEGLREVWQHSAPGLGEPVLEGNHIWVRTAKELLHLTLDQPGTESIPGRFIGQLSVHQGVLRCLISANSGSDFYWMETHSYQIARAKEELVLPAECSEVQRGEARLCPTPSRLWLDARGLRWPDAFQQLRRSWIGLGAGLGYSANTFTSSSLGDRLRSSPACCNEGLLSWASPDPSKDSSGPDLALVAAPSGNQPEVTLRTLYSGPLAGAWGQPLCVAAGGCVQGALAFEPNTGRVLWRIPRANAHSTVPLKEGALTVVGERTLERWVYGDCLKFPLATRAPAGALNAEWQPQLAGPLALALWVAPGEAQAKREFWVGALELTENGLEPSEATRIALDSLKVNETTAAAHPQPKSSLRNRELRCLLANDGSLLYARDWPSLAAALEAQRWSLDRLAFEQLLPLAKRCADAGGLESFLPLARPVASEKELKPLNDALERLRSPKRTGKARQEELNALQAGLASTRKARQALCDQTFVTLCAPTPDPLAWDALAQALQDSPWAAAAAARVRELLPPGVSADPNQPLSSYLLLARLHQRGGVQVLRPDPEADPATASRELKILNIRAHQWRPDLVAYQTNDLLLVTPLSTPTSIATCLARGQLLCEVLRAEFLRDAPASALRVREENRRMRIELCEDRAEFLRISGGPGRGMDPLAPMAAGLYNHGDQISYLFVEPGDRDLSNTIQTFLHELVHQWIDLRCPLLANCRDVRSSRGYWVAEGIASCAEGWHLDPWNWQLLSTDLPTAHLQLAQGLPEDKWFPWAGLLKWHQAAAFQRAKERFSAHTWGWMPQEEFNGVNLFYSQSAALSAALFADPSPNRRGALLRCLVAHYSDSAAQEDQDILALTGLDAEGLQALVRAYLARVYPRASTPPAGQHSQPQ
jgi:hypothetical protein